MARHDAGNEDWRWACAEPARPCVGGRATAHRPLFAAADFGGHEEDKTVVVFSVPREASVPKVVRELGRKIVHDLFAADSERTLVIVDSPRDALDQKKL